MSGCKELNNTKNLNEIGGRFFSPKFQMRAQTSQDLDLGLESPLGPQTVTCLVSMVLRHYFSGNLLHSNSEMTQIYRDQAMATYTEHEQEMNIKKPLKCEGHFATSKS